MGRTHDALSWVGRPRLRSAAKEPVNRINEAIMAEDSQKLQEMKLHEILATVTYIHTPEV